MEDELKTTLRTLASEFARVSGRKVSGIWASAAKDARFMDRIESGQSFTVKTFDRAVQWFSTNWPGSAVWPANVSRPAPEMPVATLPPDRPHHAPKSGAEAGQREGEDLVPGAAA